MGKWAQEYRAGSAEPFHGPDVEYRAKPGVPAAGSDAVRGHGRLTVVCIVTPLAFPDVGAAIFGALAVYFGVSYLWRARFRTRVTSKGIDVRGYLNHFVPRDRVRDIEVSALGPDRAGLDDDFGTSEFGRMGRAGPRVVASANSGRKCRTRAASRFVKANGHKVLLRAPLVSGWAAYLEFDDKARQLHELCVRYGRGAIA
jgi:hypothetical protein